MIFHDFKGRGGLPRFFYAPNMGANGGGETDPPAPAGDDGGKDSGQKPDKTFTRDELNKILAAEKNKLKEDILNSLKLEKEEQERLAKLDEKARLDEAIKKLKGEAETAKKEKEMLQLRYDTVAVLAKDGLPADAVDLVLAGSAEETQKRIEALKDIISAQVESAKPGWLKGNTPDGKTPPGGKVWTLAEVRELAEKSPAEYERHSKEIYEQMAQGLIK